MYSLLSGFWPPINWLTDKIMVRILIINKIIMSSCPILIWRHFSESFFSDILIRKTHGTHLLTYSDDKSWTWDFAALLTLERLFLSGGGTEPRASVINNSVDRHSGRRGGAAVCQCDHRSPPARRNTLISVKWRLNNDRRNCSFKAAQIPL